MIAFMLHRALKEWAVKMWSLTSCFVLLRLHIFSVKQGKWLPWQEVATPSPFLALYRKKMPPISLKMNFTACMVHARFKCESVIFLGDRIACRMWLILKLPDIGK